MKKKGKNDKPIWCYLSLFLTVNFKGFTSYFLKTNYQKSKLCVHYEMEIAKFWLKLLNSWCRCWFFFFEVELRKLLDGMTVYKVVIDALRQFIDTLFEVNQSITSSDCWWNIFLSLFVSLWNGRRLHWTVILCSRSSQHRRLFAFFFGCLLGQKCSDEMWQRCFGLWSYFG